MTDTEYVLSGDEILGADDTQTVKVKCPEWAPAGADPATVVVLIRGMDGTARDEFEAGSVKQLGQRQVRNLVNFRARLVARCAVSAEGKLLFKPDQVAALGRKSAAALDRCFAVASKLSGLTSKDVKDLTGNSGPAPSGPSTSD